MTELIKYQDLPPKKFFFSIFMYRGKFIITDHYDEEKEKEHNTNWSLIILVTQ